MPDTLKSPDLRFPLSQAELITSIAHFHRAEIARMAGWRDRLDQTSNWAITVVAAMLSVSLSTATAHHGVLLFAMLLVLLLLWIEARRYRFFDVYRTRVRQLERHYFAQIFSPQKEYASDWPIILGESLRSPKFLISRYTAFARRLRRNYIHMFVILLMAWCLKISTPGLQSDDLSGRLFHRLDGVLSAAALGPLPGWSIVGAVACFYLALLAMTFSARDDEGELSHGSVHV